MRLRPITLVLSLVAAGCSSTQASSSSSETPLCFSPDGGQQPCLGCAVPKAQWAAKGPLSCPRSVADYCDQNARPVPSTTAPGCFPSDWSTLFASQIGGGGFVMGFTCDGFNLAFAPGWSCGTSTEVLFVYDGPSGKLASVVELDSAHHPDQQTCLAGASSTQFLDFTGARCKPFDCFSLDSGIDDGGMCHLDAGAAAD